MHRQIYPNYAEQPSAMLLLETMNQADSTLRLSHAPRPPKQWNDGMNQAKVARCSQYNLPCFYQWLNPDQSHHCQQPQQTNALPTKSAVATRVRSTNKNGAA